MNNWCVFKLQSRNKKSEPQQKIHRITNTFPSNPASPFFGPEPIKRLGVVRLRRIHPEAGGSNVCDEEKEFKAGEDFVGVGEVDSKDSDSASGGKKKGKSSVEEEVSEELTEEQLEALLLGPKDRRELLGVFSLFKKVPLCNIPPIPCSLLFYVIYSSLPLFSFILCNIPPFPCSLLFYVIFLPSLVLFCFV